METQVLDEFREVVGKGLITDKSQLHTYECDGLTNFRVLPQAVLLPTSTEQVQIEAQPWAASWSKRTE